MFLLKVLLCIFERTFTFAFAEIKPFGNLVDSSRVFKILLNDRSTLKKALEICEDFEWAPDS